MSWTKKAALSARARENAPINLINKMASETGGRAFFPQSLSELPQIANEIVRDLRTQYVLAYNPTNKARDGSYRIIKVAVTDAPGRDKRIALTRSGRNAPRGAAPTTRAVPPPTTDSASRCETLRAGEEISSVKTLQPTFHDCLRQTNHEVPRL